jgi:6-phosphofructokinase 2
MMRPVLTVTLNPALDVTTHIAALKPRQKLRCGDPVAHPGGGGVNISRAIRELGGDSRAFVALGGPTGKRLETLLKRAGLTTEVWPLTEENRTSFTVMEDASGLPYRFVLPGPTISPGEADAILTRLDSIIAAYTGYVVASGSLPPGVPIDFYARLASRARAHGARFVIDTHGAALRAAATERPYLIRLNHLEAQELVGGDADKAAHALARDLVRDGHTEIAIVSLGERGAILSTASGEVEFVPPHVQMKSGVGAGDSFVGALVFALASGWPIEDATRYGVAAAASAVTTEATGLCKRDDAETYYSLITQIDPRQSAPGATSYP